MNILICGQSYEVLTNSIIDHLQEKGATPVVLERYNPNHKLSFVYDNNDTRVFLSTPEGEYTFNSETFPAVYWRVKPILKSELPGASPHENEQFCISEWRHALSAIPELLNKSFFINPWHASRRASLKILQLEVAIKLGFNVPKTVITNSSKEVLKTLKSSIIYKTLSSFSTETHAIYTNEVDRSAIETSEPSIAMAPSIFQEKLEKQYELRITVVGSNLFAIKIDSQKYSGTSLDWRKELHEDICETTQISEELKVKILDFQRHFGLVFGAYDFVVDKTGKEFFLECNPEGQWPSGLLGDKICESIATLLINKRSS